MYLHLCYINKWIKEPSSITKEERKVYKILVGKLEGKRPLGRPMHRWEDGIRMDLRDIGWGGNVE
jgi:hypothetical protein